MKTCFVSAPQGTTLDTLQDALRAHGMTPLVPEQLSPGTDLASETQRQLRHSDLVIAVLPTMQQSPWVLFELGLAWGLGKRIVVIAPPEAISLPATMHRLLILQTTPDNRPAIDFTLDQVLSAPRQPEVSAQPEVFVSLGLGPESDNLLSRLEESLRDVKPCEFEQLLHDAIKGSGADVVVESPQRDRGVDLVVWSDVLDAFVGNPLVIEAKLNVSSPRRAKDALETTVGGCLNQC